MVTKQVNMRLSGEDIARINLLAKALDLSQAGVVRRLLDEYEKRPRLPTPPPRPPAPVVEEDPLGIGPAGIFVAKCAHPRLSRRRLIGRGLIQCDACQDVVREDPARFGIPVGSWFVDL